MNEDPNKIRITADDLQNVQLEAPSPVMSPAPNAAGSAPRQWGNISDAIPGGANATSSNATGASFFFKSWVYLGLAGFVAAFIAWAICEPGFDDGGKHRWGNVLLLPFLVTSIAVSFAVAESAVERSLQKGLTRGILALLLGIVLGVVFTFLANLIFMLGAELVAGSGTAGPESPAFWFARAIAWMIFGVTGGIVYGIAGQSGKKCLYGMLGGMLGASIGGFCFDPISLMLNGAEVSRCFGLTVFGGATGIAIGLVESALKNRWLYVSGGPLAGKQFILYKPVTRFGSQQSNDIYLFKDLSIAPTHAIIELRGPHATLIATAPTFVGGQPVTQRVLRSGDIIQIGRYTFQYQEKQAQ